MQLENKYTKTKGLVAGENDLLTWCKDHGEEGQIIIKEWDSTRNGDMTKYKAGSAKKVYWICDICGESYVKTARERVLGTMHGPCGRKRGIENLRQWHREIQPIEKSLAYLYPELLKEWDYEKNRELGFEPEYLSAYSAKKVYWKCSQCKKPWRAVIRVRTMYNNKCKHCKDK